MITRPRADVELFTRRTKLTVVPRIIAGSDYSIFHTKRGRLFEGGDYIQLLDELYVISRIIKVEVGVISRGWRLRLITLTETLIILDITKTESNIKLSYYTLNESDIKCLNSKFVPTLSFSEILSVFSLSRNQQTAPLPPSSTFSCLWVLVFNYFFDVLLGQRSKPGSNVFASSLTASNTKRANLTWLPLEIMHHGHTWHDYPWPWVFLTWLLYKLQRDDVPGTCVGNVHNVSSTHVAEFDFLTENLNSGCLTCAYSLWFSFKRFLYHIMS